MGKKTHKHIQKKLGLICEIIILKIKIKNIAHVYIKYSKDHGSTIQLKKWTKVTFF